MCVCEARQARKNDAHQVAAARAEALPDLQIGSAKTEFGMVNAPYLSRKNVAAREFVANSLGDIQHPPRAPWLKHICKIKHVWVNSKFNRRCSRCGLEETKP